MLEPEVAFTISREDRWRIKRELKAYFRSIFSRAPKSRRILIFAQGRTGSTLLESLLESTGYFHGKGEVLGAPNEKVRFPIAYIKGIARKFADENVVCHVKIYQLDHDRIEQGARPVDPRQFLKAMYDDGWQIIALRRTSKFDHYISGCLARARGAYHKRDDRPENTCLIIDRAELERGIRNRSALDVKEAEALASIPHKAIEYERDLATPELQSATIANLLQSLDLEQRPAKTQLKKIADRSAVEFIGNYAEAREWARSVDGA
ncbi:hypothetical protein [Blastomonas aquatica]|uniref:Sulphotransferase Stf0 domain-containing protein n=1 Tax=Blastomonas aquatica TaxID=1510276 RepID=A0ABQ1JVZ2_9SPHN|nr:hypothetical protein [Blastomonas aquatica]GGB75533.1 hypothetical protein GCM10010833_33450 [Blastomonas aquatica]